MIATIISPRFAAQAEGFDGQQGSWVGWNDDFATGAEVGVWIGLEAV
jgi:hypothetical protein